MAVPGTVEGGGDEVFQSPEATAVSGTNLKVATRPAVVGPAWFDVFHPGTPVSPSVQARVRVVADVVGALTQIHGNSGLPREHRRHGRVTPRHVLIGVDGTASLFDAKQPFSKLLPQQPDLGYLAPELLTQSGPSDQRSDIFSIGVLLWEALDNGRLFPHHRAAAISRLIARKGLPLPRVNDEWALPLVDVAHKALASEPQDRYQSATELWLALREHLPAPDAAREELSAIAQRTLKLSLTSDIRSAPPFISSAPASLTSSLSIPGAPSMRPATLDTRYSMPVEHMSFVPRSSQQPLISESPGRSSLAPLDWNSLMPGASSVGPPSFEAAGRSRPPAASQSPRASQVPASQRVSHGPAAPHASSVPPASAARLSAHARQEVQHSSSYPPSNRELAQAAAHELAQRTSWNPESAPPPQRGSQWLALALVVVAFVGVGVGAVVFGAGTAMGPKLGGELHTPAPVPALAAPPLNQAQPQVPAAAAATVSAGTEPAAPGAEVDQNSSPSEAPKAGALVQAKPEPVKARAAPHPAREVKKAKRAKPTAPAAAEPPKPSAAPEEALSPENESLPFVTEPWSNPN